MQTTINQISPVEYELVIDAAADDLASEIREALRAQRQQTQLKGFRPGKVPLNLVKKMYGRALAYGVAEKKVQRTYEETVVDADDYEVLGPPTITELTYDLDEDLHAVVRFGVRPEVELQDLSGEQISKLVHEVTDEDVDKEVEQLRRREADLVPVEEGGAGEKDQVVVDLQQVDEESGSPIIGEREEDVSFFLDDGNLHDELREALLGKEADATFQVDLPHGEGAHQHTHRYQVTVKEVKRLDLPEVDDAFVGEVTDDQFDTVDALRESIREQLEQAWEKQTRELLEQQVVERMLELHPVPVPASAVDLYLDYFIEDVKRRNDGELPEGFDEAAFRETNRGEAEQQARWMLVRDAVIAEADLEVTDEDLDGHFEEMAGDDAQISAQMMRQYYEQMGVVDRVRDQQLSRKVYDTLVDRFDVVEKDRETLEAELKERAEQRRAAQAEMPAPAEPAEEPAEEAAEPAEED